jgi:glycerol uptake facilitator-like aquaporin
VLSFFPPGARELVARGTPQFDPALISPAAAMVLEVILTFFLVFAIWGSAADPRARNVGGMAIGFAVALDILAGGPLTGASMNPARSFGPALVANQSKLWAQQWVYWVGPILGGVGAACVYHLFIWPRDEKTGAEPPAADVPAAQR